MLRLARHAFASESGGSPREFSSGLYAATSCEDIAFPWPRFSAPASRFGSISAAVGQIPAASLYPFDAATAAGNDFIRMCRRWPEAAPGPFAPAGPLPDVPVLMLSGEVDLRTPVETAISAAAGWPRAQRLTVPGTGHSTLSADYSGCAQRAAARFLRGQSVATRCRRGQPLVPPLPPAPLSLRELRPAPQVAGERGRTMSAVDLTLLDVATEFFTSLFTSTGPVVRGGGLRGGRWELDVRAGRELLRLHAVEYLPGLRLSGTVSRFLSRRPVGRLRVSGSAGAEGFLRWTPRLIEGELDGKQVRSQPRGAAAGIAAAAGPAAWPTHAQVLRAGQRLAERRPSAR
jgi:hypothetical protein